MNSDRLLREVGKRLDHISPDLRSEILDALREEIGRERRRRDPSLTVEAERKRRQEAESLRDVLEAINRSARLEETIEEVLKQLGRIVSFDACALALVEGEGVFRTLAVRGVPDPERMVGQKVVDPLQEAIRASRFSLAIPDVTEDPRFTPLPGSPEVRSWAGIPLLVEGEAIGLLSIARARVEPFDEEDLHRARAVAFSAAAAIYKARLLEQVRRYATLMERVVQVDAAVFAGSAVDEIARQILEGALHLGEYRGGLLVLDAGGGARVAAARGEAFEGSAGKLAPAPLAVRTAGRLEGSAATAALQALGVAGPTSLYLVPVAAPAGHLGTLVLSDPDGETPDDRLMEAYASRAANAYLHALRRAASGS